MDETVIVVIGAAPIPPEVTGRLPRSAIVIAADGGLDHARGAGLTPAALVGDLDSVSADGLAWAKEHCTIHQFDTNKSATDTELAIELADSFSPERLILVSGGGKRLDHGIAALGALGHPHLTSIPVIEAWWGTQHARVLHGPGATELDVTPGTPLSLLAMHGPCTGVSIDGVHWPLVHADLAPLSGHGISNTAVSPTISVAVHGGILTLFLDLDNADTNTETP